MSYHSEEDERMIAAIAEDAAKDAGPLCRARFEALQRTETLAGATAAVAAHEAECAVCREARCSR